MRTEKFNHVTYVLCDNEEEMNSAVTTFDTNESFDGGDKFYTDPGKIHNCPCIFLIRRIGDFSSITAIAIDISNFSDNRNLKQKVLDLCKKYNVTYERIKYYKESPYQKNRYKPEYVGEEVWLKVNGFNYKFNSIEDCDPLGQIDDYFCSVMDNINPNH